METPTVTEIAEQLMAPDDRRQAAEQSGPTRRGNRWTNIVAGAVGGLIATGPMSVAMALLYRRLPWWQPWSLPPREITANMLKSIGVHEHMSREAETVATTVGHFAYGTFAGAVYGALPGAIRRHALTSGVLYGLAVWAGSYGAGLPALRLATPLPYRSGKRIGLMIAAHVVWGAVLGPTSQAVARVAFGPDRAEPSGARDEGGSPTLRPSDSIDSVAVPLSHDDEGEEWLPLEGDA
jgi:uncharacterized membrane protein YagU involved in acid resistance